MGESLTMRRRVSDEGLRVVELWNGKKALTLESVAYLDSARMQINSERSSPDLNAPLKAMFDVQGTVYIAIPENYERACSLDTKSVQIIAGSHPKPEVAVSDLVIRRLTIIAQRYLDLRETAKKIFTKCEGWEDPLYQITKYVVHILISIPVVESTTNKPEGSDCCYSKKDREQGRPFSVAMQGNKRVYIHTKIVISKNECKIIMGALQVDHIASKAVVRLKQNKKPFLNKESIGASPWDIEVAALELLLKAKRDSVDLAGILAPQDIIRVTKKKAKHKENIQEKVYIYVEMMDYPNLNRFIALNRLAPIQQANLGYKIAKAVDTLHNLGIYHRDLKPDNVVINRQGNPGIVDYGSAKIIGKVFKNSPLPGTRGYLPPEVDKLWPNIQNEDIDVQAWDAWCLGILLLFIQTGYLPDFVIAQNREGSPQFNTSLQKFYQTPMPSSQTYDWIYRSLLTEDSQQRMTVSSAKTYFRLLCTEG